MLINTENLNFSYISDEILKDVSFRVDPKERIGLVGRNGCGKSTLLKLLSGRLTPDSGSINKRSGLSIGYLEQEPSFPGNPTLDEVFSSVFEDLDRQEARMRELEELIAESSGTEQEKYLEEYGALQEHFDSVNAYSRDSRIRGITTGLKFSEEDLKKPFNVLSGGEKTRAALGRLLLAEPDLLLLDEPTNYLDIDTLQWLENLLRSYPGSFVLVSHDRYFLNAVCTRIDEVENRKLISYPGNYSSYTARKEKRLIEQDAQYASAMREIERQKAIIKRYRDVNSKQSSRHARSREIALSKMDVPEKRFSEQNAHFEFTPKVRSGNEVLEAENLSKSFGNQKLFENVNFQIMRTDRVGIIGPNGAGKTTLFNILQRRELKDSGRIRLGRKVIPGCYDQENRDLDAYAENTLIEALRGDDVTMNDGVCRSILASFLFTGEDVFKLVKNLSGGEKARLLLAKLMLSEANFLLMDEPTNHIDMRTKEILENALSAYQGTLLFISHDRYFLNQVADRILVLTPEGVEEYIGNYDDYLKQKADSEERARQSAEAPETVTRTQAKADRKRQKEAAAELRALKKKAADLENELETADARIAELEAVMCRSDFYDDQTKATAVLQEYEELKANSESLTDQWEEATLLWEEADNNAKNSV